MSVQKLSELPEITGEDLYRAKKVLVEVSFETDAGYRSCYMTYDNLQNLTFAEITRQILKNLRISEDGYLKITGGDVNLDGKKFTGRFGQIEFEAKGKSGNTNGTITLYAENGITLDSQPVIIADNLEVRTSFSRSGNEVVFRNSDNIIHVSDGSVSKPNKMINLKALKEVLG